MKNIINNNVSADMKEFGYSIVVDPSIVNLSNYFVILYFRWINWNYFLDYCHVNLVHYLWKDSCIFFTTYTICLWKESEK